MKAIDTNIFYKLHGTGNDFIIIHEKGRKLQELQNLARQLCHRNYGIGANGLLIIKQKEEGQNNEMIVINENGTYAEMCGNGLRCFSGLLFYLGLVSEIHSIKTGAGQKKCKIVTSDKNKLQVQVEMGNYESLQLKNIFTLLNQTIQEIQQNAYFIQSSNPHLVVFVKDLKHIDASKIGHKIQNIVAANINFCQILNEKQVQLITYERGCGVTLACGTGSCATAITCHEFKKCNDVITIMNAGGNLQINCSDKKNVKMCGPAVLVASGQYFDSS